MRVVVCTDAQIPAAVLLRSAREATMATMKRSKGPEGEEVDSRAASMAGYNSEIDTFRGKEFPTLQGRSPEVDMLSA